MSGQSQHQSVSRKEGSAVQQDTVFELAFALAFGKVDGSQHSRLTMVIIHRLGHHQFEGLHCLGLAKTAQPVLFTFQFQLFQSLLFQTWVIGSSFLVNKHDAKGIMAGSGIHQQVNTG